jgi:sialidase-1
MVMKNAFLLFFLFSLSLATRAQSPERTLLWKTGEGGIFAHFVYGLLVTGKGTVLAVAEARIKESADDGAHHIVLKRSMDGGQSFSTSQVIVRSNSGESWANPTLVQDSRSKLVFLFYALNHHNDSTDIFLRTSKDDGLSWSAPQQLSHLFSNDTYGRTFHLPGPGHGIQLKNGRLLIPVWHRRSIAFKAQDRRYGVSCIYSDDHGSTWKAGAGTPVGELNESQLVALRGEEVLLIGRTISGKHGSYQAKLRSPDGGLSWDTALVYDARLKGPACDIGITGFANHPGWVAISQPAGPKRQHLYVRLSRDGGLNWTERLLQPGGATYSDLAVLPDKTIICLYGHGGTQHMPDSVSVARLGLDWLDGEPLKAP